MAVKHISPYLPKISSPKRACPRKLALVIAAHNEEMFIQLSIYSAMAAGQPVRDIYVVDDGSRDTTRRLAVELLGSDNVLSIGQSGKSRALAKLLKRRHLLKRYQWIHFADADTLFDKGYFKAIRRAAKPDLAAVTGYIQSLAGTTTSEYRVYEYTWSMEIARRVQTPLNLITVIPGPSACIRSDVVAQLDMASGLLTEDFDWTVQIHRRKLGRIGYVPEARLYTQDPRNLHDFRQQLNRWYRGIWQVALMRRLGLKGRRQDWYFLYQVIQVMFSFVVFFVVAPLSILLSGNWLFAAWLFLTDLTYLCAMVLLSGLRAKRPDIIANLPQFYLMRWISTTLFLKAMVDVLVLGRYQEDTRGWTTADRRYRLAQV